MLLLIILIIILVYFPSLGLFFFSDDWFHLKISQINSSLEFVNFFSFSPTPQTAAFYRPLPTQVFFFIFQKIFSLNPLPYHLFALLIFAFNLYLIFRLSKIITKNYLQSILIVIFYGFSVSNFTRLYFLSAFQEIALVLFCVLSLIFYLKNNSKTNYFLSILFFIGALLCKETAVTLPLLLIAVDWYQKRIKFKTILPYIAVLIPYLYFRLFVFVPVGGDSYLWSFSPIKIANTLGWYTLWSIGAPETLVDYVGSGFQILPRFFSDFSTWAYLILIFLFGNISFICFLTVKNIRKNGRICLYAISFFILSLLPVLFLPSHKFSLELGLPLIGFSLFLSQIYGAPTLRSGFPFHVCRERNPSEALLSRAKGDSPKNRIGLIGIFLFLFLNLSMHYFTYYRHYAVNRAKAAQKITHYFLTIYSKYPKNSYFEFINDTTDYGLDWGASKQISHITSGSNLFQVIYSNPEIKVYFADIPENKPRDKQKIEISTRQFFQ